MSKQHSLDLIRNLDQDELVKPGKFMFILSLSEELVKEFAYLHSS